MFPGSSDMPKYAGVSAPKVAGSNPAPATNHYKHWRKQRSSDRCGPLFDHYTTSFLELRSGFARLVARQPQLYSHTPVKTGIKRKSRAPTAC